MKYSVIIPVYKVESVLSRCVESILRQTVTDFELILVDDGSPDRSGIICDEYAATDPRIQVIHQDNSGVSGARNAGLDIAQGEYIVFVDSDDYIENNYLESFDIDESDLVVSCTTVYEADGSIKERTFEERKNISVSSEEDQIAFLKKWYALQVCGKRFKRELIEKSLRFNPDFQYGEDSIFMAQYLRTVSTISVVSNATYNYCLENSESLTKKADKQWFSDYVVLQEYIWNIFIDCPCVQHFLASKFCWVVETQLVKICNEKQSIREKKNAIAAVLDIPHLSICIKQCNKDLPFITKMLFKFKIPWLVLLRYSYH